MRNFLDKRCRENTNFIFYIFLYSVTFFFFENLAVYEITWKNIVQLSRPQTMRLRMRIARWIPKSTDTPSEYVILAAYPL
jgi:hypothetical protein